MIDVGAPTGLFTLAQLVAATDDDDGLLHAERVRVVLADVEGIAREALKGVLLELAGVRLVTAVGTRAALADALRHGHVDVLVIDDRLVQDGRHVLAGLGPIGTRPRTVVVGVDDDPGFAARAQRLGAVGWVAKDRADEDLPRFLEQP
jgi:DNA-binding NarL/FixJ family response regulator